MKKIWGRAVGYPSSEGGMGSHMSLRNVYTGRTGKGKSSRDERGRIHAREEKERKGKDSSGERETRATFRRRGESL